MLTADGADSDTNPSDTDATAVPGVAMTTCGVGLGCGGCEAVNSESCERVLIEREDDPLLDLLCCVW